MTSPYRKPDRPSGPPSPPRRPRWLAWLITAVAVLGLSIGNAALLWPGHLMDSHAAFAALWGTAGVLATIIMVAWGSEAKRPVFWLSEDE